MTATALRATRPSAALLIAAVTVLGAFAGRSDAATRGTFVPRTFTEPAASGLAVTGPLSDLRATARARVLAPTAWRSRRAPVGRLRFAATQNASCHYDVTYTVRSLLAPTGPDAAARVTAGLPPAGPRYLLDSGVHNDRAFRVVRQPSTGGRVRLDALWTAVLTRRADIVPAGQTAWSEIRVTALSRRGDECHAGTWREALGPTIGDSLAVARAGLRFSRPR